MTIKNQLKTLMNYYKNLFNFRGKNVFILGGSGLIGQEVSKAILELEGRVINLDIKNNSKKVDKNYKFEYLNVENVNKLSKKIFLLLKNMDNQMFLLIVVTQKLKIGAKTISKTLA